MAANIIIDTGVIVALADRRDEHHYWCKKKVAELSYPFYTCEAVLSESFHLLESISNGSEKLINNILEKELIQVPFIYSKHSASVHKIITKYANLPAGFADACLVAMAETMRSAYIFTLDSDFMIYRLKSGKPLSIITPR
jgi:predicted nucleic acid-binding protein